MMTTASKFVIAGGSGFLGRTLSRWLANQNADVIVLSRKPLQQHTGIRQVGWDGRTRGDWCRELEGAKAVINLAGRSVDCRYHARNRRLILDSRIDSTRVIGAAIRNCDMPPAIWLNSSTATIYKHSVEKSMDETNGVLGATVEAKDAFSIEVATAWENTLAEAMTPHTRKVALRTAMVLSSEPGTVFRVLRRLSRMGLGGPMGNGRQYVSWIHELDFCRAVDWIMARDDFVGAINLAAPNPLPNCNVMRLIRESSCVPFGLPASRLMLEIGAFFMRTETELIIKSRRVVPGRLLESGFKFQFPALAGALDDLERRTRKCGFRDGRAALQ